MSMLSLVSTWLMLGTKVTRVPDLYDLWKKKAKLAKECTGFKAASLDTASRDNAGLLLEIDPTEVAPRRAESIEMASRSEWRKQPGAVGNKQKSWSALLSMESSAAEPGK